MHSLDPLGLGARLREWRDRTQPVELGLPAGPRRKVPGLRREEVAAFADLSVDYLTRLEQGNAVNPSAEVIAALGRALRLPQAEVDLLHQLAGHAPPSEREVPGHVSPGVRRLLDRLDDVPVAAYDASWTLLVVNPLWREVLGPVDSRPGMNVVRAAFEDAPSRVTLTPEGRERLQRALVADLTLSSVRYTADYRLRGLIEDLLRRNPVFASLWADRRAKPFTAEAKQVDHPDFGPLWFDVDVLNASDGDTRVVAYTAPRNSFTGEALAAMHRAVHTVPQPDPAT